MKTKVVGVIPARWGSTRFPGKPLKMIAGSSLLSHVIAGSKSSKHVDELIVATDHKEIFAEAEKCGVRAVMTDPELASGTDRVWAAIASEDFDIAVNIQGDEPLIRGDIIDKLVAPLLENPHLEMATLGRVISEEDLESPNTAKIVLNRDSEALYFSRHPIPFTRRAFEAGSDYSQVRKHIGIYGFRTSFLKDFVSAGPSELEGLEGLEQLRALSLGAKIKVVTVDHESWGVDTPEDVLKIERLLKEAKHGSEEKS